MTRPLALAVFVSGAGTTLDALATALERGAIPARVALVVADRDGIPALAVAARHGIPASVVPMGRADPNGASERLDAVLPTGSVDLVVLAGLRAILPGGWLARWEGRVVNVHPSLLPRHGGPGLYGHHVYDAILASGDRESGATVHVVTEEVDAGPRLLQDRFPVEPGDTPESLQARTQALERRLLVEAVARFADGRWPLPYDGSEARAGPRDGRRGAD
jgi:phosphoribosylglycinamide formyltransferase-1